MSAVNTLLLIVRRDRDERYQALLKEAGAVSVLSFPCQGTAGKGLLSALGLQQTDKTLLLSLLPFANARRAMRRAVSDLGLNLPGEGIALRLPVDAFGGAGSMRVFLNDFKPEEVVPMDVKELRYTLIVAVCAGGHTAEVMDAAREGGAEGGTVVHAKGTAGVTGKFLGVSLGAEKEIILIVSARKNRDQVMKAIMAGAGISSPAQTVLFALPVEEVSGLKAVIEAAADGDGAEDAEEAEDGADA